jgi:Ca2+-binding RTX toxin-like protein
LLIDAPAGHVGKGKSTTFTVRLDTASAGARSGTLGFSTNDADENPFNFTIKGQVDAPSSPELTLLINNAAVNSGATIDFGAVTQGGAAPTRSFTISNTGNAPLSIANLSVPSGFALVDGADASLAPGESDIVTLRMATGTVGQRSGALTFNTSDADEGSISFNLTGKVNAGTPTPPPPPPPPSGPAPLVTLSLVRRGNTPLAIADGATAPVNFGTVPVGSIRPMRTFTVTNRGNATLTLGRVEVPPGFILAGKLALTLAPGQSDEFTVAMDTATAGPRSGQIRIATNDSRAPVLNFSIAGNVVEPVDPSPGPGGGTFSFVRGTLTIFGTAGNDVIILTGSGTTVNATANGRAMSSTPFNGVSKIVVNAGGGDDRVSLAALSINGTINGGPGDDTLEGSQADDVLNGGDDNDVLLGNDGRDNLLGGTGDDSLTGGGGIDAFHGELGNDTLNALDGLADALLDGGAGTDVIKKDRTDPAEI